jgi:biotin synthase
MLERSEVLRWLRTTAPEELSVLWQRANDVRQREVGEDVHLRGLIELSSYCRRSCTYCGISAHNKKLTRYRMDADEIVECARTAAQLGYGTVVLQAGEDPMLTGDLLEGAIRRIKQETPLAITLSLGERDFEELARFKAAGADRYLMRFETSNRQLLDAIHPPFADLPDRFSVLREIRRLGYETGSGFMVGTPGSSFEDLANDLMLCAELELDMIGVGPYIPHPETPLGQNPDRLPPGEQVPNDELMTYKVVALARLMRPRANIPATTALATINPVNGRELALSRGANICMPNITPVKYRALYEIYPDKACMQESAQQCDGCLRGRIVRLGRRVGRGAGTSPSFVARGASAE